jgi:hypothetical protein
MEDCVVVGLVLFSSGAGVFAEVLPELIDMVESAETSLNVHQ